MEKSVFFIDKDECLYRDQRLMADYIKIGSVSLSDAVRVNELCEKIRKSIELVIVKVEDPFPIGILHRRIMPLIPNAGVLFLGGDPHALMTNFKLAFRELPTYVYGARTSATQFAIDEAIDIAFAAKHHETAKTNLKEWWGLYL